MPPLEISKISTTSHLALGAFFFLLLAKEDGEQYSADPGHVGGFGVLVDGVGRGLPRAVACGKEFTLVATYPYEGPVMEVRSKLGT